MKNKALSKPLMAQGLPNSKAWFQYASKVHGPHLKHCKRDTAEWLTVKNLSDTEGEICIFGDIVPVKWFEEDVTATDVYRQLAALNAETLTVRINSPGGSVFDGVAIYNLLRDFPGTVNVRIEGAALSIAGVIAMAGDTIEIAEGASFMMHKVWTWTAGNSDELRGEADILDTLESGIVSIFATRTGMERADIQAMVDADTWLTAEEAVEKGFADSVAKGKKKAATAEDRAARYREAVENGFLTEEEARNLTEARNSAEEIASRLFDKLLENRSDPTPAPPAPDPKEFARLNRARRMLAHNECNAKANQNRT